MGLNSPKTDCKLLGNLFIGHALCDQLQDAVLETKQVENHKFHNVLESAREIAKAKGVELQAEVVAGHPAATIVGRVKALKADLLVVGFMGHSALYERIIGGTADRLVRLAPCPVLVVK